MKINGFAIFCLTFKIFSDIYPFILEISYNVSCSFVMLNMARTNWFMALFRLWTVDKNSTINQLKALLTSGHISVHGIYFLVKCSMFQ